MNYHDIKYDDMNNGEGLRVTLFVSGCTHKCKGCHNPQTWNCKSGALFDKKALKELLSYLDNDYIDGLTLSGGDPLHEYNISEILNIIKTVKEKLPEKTIWLYTGYTFEEIINSSRKKEILELCDVLVDGEFKESLKDNNYHWAGSTNQRVIDIQKSLEYREIILFKDK